MKHERSQNYPHYTKKPKVSAEAIELAMHFGADPKEIQKALNKKRAELPQTRK
ncbi:MAG: hypothetical protein US68_C0005G0030 [Candidatus Shapirobacteria bacterium GW2011_GWE1_38_10]|uniref:Uncharacterized protein n=1 Tax=Candidatus Shapirobacteria bacterium GW2011_GWE1_38_10 TaxID=1618488 RepID=A0A0G0I544_9BACT|nr:MAG: hypothetical protein US46_C0001G0023 [Candidatus Shapirobacteria bacterium GW2011_GWF2_37_20]KKQ50463.1 MAG: hypothetical protein US68_C0005G0030 [Candidatus Shapirobacteria bacterium GW2011_GWE1_38_10]KKQ65119.1 MAG: hypothetical protein US85_C0001G0046 [Candidatus Shapirobacteria bacterium GW2011_GWF1_38_23]